MKGSFKGKTFKGSSKGGSDKEPFSSIGSQFQGSTEILPKVWEDSVGPACRYTKNGSWG